MSNGFAGAKSVDDRRRRRLAQEESAGLPRRRSRSSAQSAGSTSLEESIPRSAPARTWLWRQPWKYAALLIALMLLDVGLVLHTAFSLAGVESSPVTALRSSEEWITQHLARAYFVACALTAWLILHHRSRSRLDFSGRYRLWIWLALFWSAMSACSIGSWHDRFGEWLAGKANLHGWNGPLWCWLIPATAALLASTSLLRYELAACRTAWRIHLASLPLAAFAAGSLLLKGTSLDGPWLAPATTLTVMLWPTLELGALLLFARHVVHVTNEPSRIPRKRRVKKRTFAKLLKRLAAWMFAPRDELPAYGPETAKPARKRSTKPSAKSRRKTTAKRAASRRTTEVEEEIDETPETTPKAEQAPLKSETTATRAQPARPQAQPTQQPTPKQEEPRPATQLRVDPPQAKRGPRFAEPVAQREELEAVAVQHEKQRMEMEDDFGDVDDWSDEESETPRHRRTKGKKKRRR